MRDVIRVIVATGMERLPFLIEHGDLAWKAIALLAAGVAIAAARRGRARWERRAIQRALAACAARTTAPIDGVATIRGTLHGGRASSVSLLQLRGCKPYYDERAPGLWVDCDGARVTLEGAIRVVHGARAVATRHRRSTLPDGEPAVRSSPILHRHAAVAVSVRDGDAVYVTARLAARPGDQVAGYREATTAWTATRDGDAIELVAAAPARRAIPLGATRGAAAALFGAAVAIGALWSVGAAAVAWTRATTPATGRLVAVELDELDAIAIAAATPGHRGAALALLEQRFATRYHRTGSTYLDWLHVAGLRGGCGAEIRALIEQEDVQALAQYAPRCDDDRAAAEAFEMLGMFRAAVERDERLPAGERHIESLIAVGAWDRAAWWAASRRDDARAADPPAARGAGLLTCARQWFRWLAGTDTSVTIPAMLAIHDPGCAVIAGLALPQSQQAAARAAADPYRPGERQIQQALAWAAGAPPEQLDVALDRVEYPELPFAADERITVARALLSGAALDHADAAPGSYAMRQILAWTAVRAMLSGAASRTQSPRAMLRHATAADDRHRLWGSLTGYEACDQPELGAAGNVRAVARQAVRDGDGHALAELLLRCRRAGAPALETVFAVWPEIVDGRARLAEVLRRIDLGPPAIDPLAVIARGAIRRDLAWLTGDDAVAAAWQEVLERHFAALSRYTALNALLVRELLRPVAD